MIVGGLFLLQHNAQRGRVDSIQSTAFVTEVADQHIAALAANAAPEVLSSDRHTVKPWFQGKLPFSFNLPENLPADTTLDGANLTYIHDQAAAQLLYSIGRHRVSVFLQPAIEDASKRSMKMDRSGFHVASLKAGNLEVTAVSDVDPTRLSNLASLIGQAQDR